MITTGHILLAFPLKSISATPAIPSQTPWGERYQPNRSRFRWFWIGMVFPPYQYEAVTVCPIRGHTKYANTPSATSTAAPARRATG